jgi:hypothetical protein
MLFDAHWHAFRVFDGIPSRGIYDSGNCPPLVRGQWTRRRLLIVSAEASSAI